MSKIKRKTKSHWRMLPRLLKKEKENRIGVQCARTCTQCAYRVSCLQREWSESKRGKKLTANFCEINLSPFTFFCSCLYWICIIHNFVCHFQALPLKILYVNQNGWVWIPESRRWSSLHCSFPDCWNSTCREPYAGGLLLLQTDKTDCTEAK